VGSSPTTTRQRTAPRRRLSGDDGHGNLLTADAVGAVNALQAIPAKEEIAKRLQDTGSSGADPKPYLKQLTIPARWRYGTTDREVPVDQSVALLHALKAQGKDFTVVTFPDAGHGLLDSPPTDPRHRPHSSTGSWRGSARKLSSVRRRDAAT
jgi:pimeloyl-ACP methyl ester carboxylesterase